MLGIGLLVRWKIGVLGGGGGGYNRMLIILRLYLGRPRRRAM